uniref:THUMP domain-containing protein 2 isoform X1 n=2 Tax=Pogona vitticeps TaxID=103695 RepID=A0A6J0TS73_9SAUR
MADGGHGGRHKEAEEEEEAAGASCASGGSARYFCTAGRGMEAFLLREVRARLDATEVDCASGKVFFTTSAELTRLKKLKSAERLFLLLNRSPPLSISRNKGKVIHDIHRLVSEDPSCWLDTVAVWQRLHGQEMKPEDMCQKSPASRKRKMEDERNIKPKNQKGEPIQSVPAESQIEKTQTYDTSEALKENVLSEDTPLLEKTHELIQENSTEESSCFTFRVSCRSSGALAKIFTAQDLGRIIGIALMKSFGWKADLRNPDIEIFVHLNDLYTVIGIPVFRLPLASRVYIKTAGLRSTVAWAMASLAEIKTGAFVLDPTCGLGTLLLEAATEWPNVHYLGVDISDSQLQGAYSNIKAASLMDKIQLLKASATALPLTSESIDIALADIPFGKKFKITKDMELIPDILQELERVLCAGGTAVLLLSQELYKRLSNNVASDPDSNVRITVEPANDCTKSTIMSVKSNPEEESCSPCTAPSSAQEGEQEQIVRKRTTLGSLMLMESIKVSLGRTDAFICKYKKLTASLTKR